MPLVVVGLNHRSAPFGLLERVSISQSRLPQALHKLVGHKHVIEGFILSTCNRVELYAQVSAFHGGAQDLKNFLADFCNVSREELVDHLYTYHEQAAARHLFRVAAGIDSMVLGESEILGQVKRAFRAATEEGTIHRALGPVFRRALAVGKRARAATGIVPISISSTSVELARRSLPKRTLEGKRASVVGAGEIGFMIAHAIREAGAIDLVIVNRSDARGRDVAREHSGTFRHISQLEAVIRSSDVVFCSTSAEDAIISRPMLERAMSTRGETAPLLIVDVGVPRNVAAEAGDVRGVTLRDLSHLRALLPGEMNGHSDEISSVETIISQELENYLESEQMTDISPTLSALVAKANTTREIELQRFLARTNHLTSRQLEEVEQLSRRIVAKLLHSPLVRTRRLAQEDRGPSYVSIVRELFDLDEAPVSAVLDDSWEDDRVAAE